MPTASASSSAPIESVPKTGRKPTVDLKTPAVDLGAPAIVALSRDWMVSKDKQENLVVSKWQGTFYEPFTTPSEEFSTWPIALATGSKTHAYWISGNLLVRREVLPSGAQGPKTVLTHDAAPSLSIQVARASEHPSFSESQRPSAGEVDVVLYLGSVTNEQTGQVERAARLWIEGQGSRDVSHDAGRATSTALLSTGPRQFIVLTLDGRLGMSPVHAISLELNAHGKPILGEDRVVYVAGPAEQHSSLTGVLVGQHPVALLPISKTTVDFGMLVFRVGKDTDDPPWIDYPNGLDPAPVATTTVCGLPTVVFVRPDTGEVDSDKVVELGWLDEQGKLRDRQVLDRDRAIFHVAIWSDGLTGSVVYAMSSGLRGRRLICR